jgi:hypothetical protein
MKSYILITLMVLVLGGSAAGESSRAPSSIIDSGMDGSQTIKNCRSDGTKPCEISSSKGVQPNIGQASIRTVRVRRTGAAVLALPYLVYR